MIELKACPVCGYEAQAFFGYDYGKVGCKNHDCNYSHRPQYPDDWNNRPHENKIKAEAYIAGFEDNNEGVISFDPQDAIDSFKEWVKL